MGMLAFRIFVFIAGVVLLCPFSSSAEHITVSGCSVSNSGYLSELAKEYERKTGQQVFVRGGGSVVGLEDLKTGKVDLAASCRKRMEGDPSDIKFIQVAWDALVFIVNKNNPVEDISLEEIRGIYNGRITSWKSLDGPEMPIKLFASRPQRGLSGVESSTKELVLEGRDIIKGGNTLSLASTAIVEQMVEKTPEGIAVSGFSSARKRDVKMLKINGVKPAKETITSGRYPFRRPLYVLLPAKSKPAVKKFVDYILGKEGQRFISSMGVIALKEVK
ncbi:MAG: phosphate ABC transporter substrate-binding protein [Nitrospirae bacterium]|nr:MAG: phosphate ABC transporter substrate-binding protein [Nitrospirota bacterium]